jgi:hypothetical protein
MQFSPPLSYDFAGSHDCGTCNPGTVYIQSPISLTANQGGSLVPRIELVFSEAMTGNTGDLLAE